MWWLKTICNKEYLMKELEAIDSFIKSISEYLADRSDHFKGLLIGKALVLKELGVLEHIHIATLDEWFDEVSKGNITRCPGLDHVEGLRIEYEC